VKGKIGTAVAVLALLASALMACSSVQTQTSQCGWVIQNGFQQNHGVKDVVYPNQSVSKGTNDEVWYVPCNARNFRIKEGDGSADSQNSTVVMTGKGENGEPGVQTKVQWDMHWTLNEDKPTMIEFWAFCQKYTCQSAQQNDNSANNSTPGWNNMLHENMLDAINRAGADVAKQFPPSLYKDQSLWPQFAEAANKVILAELRKSVQPFDDDFFCANTTTKDGKPCAAPTFTVNQMDPVNGNLRNIDNQQSELDAQAVQNAKRLQQAEQLYGPYAHATLSQMDILAACKAAGLNCTVIIGGNGTTVVPQPAK
jgi:hypothetical protein